MNISLIQLDKVLRYLPKPLPENNPHYLRVENRLDVIRAEDKLMSGPSASVSSESIRHEMVRFEVATYCNSDTGRRWYEWEIVV